MLTNTWTLVITLGCLFAVMIALATARQRSWLSAVADAGAGHRSCPGIAVAAENIHGVIKV